ncbi:hypothetical protein OROHE_009112 [Orobanche hederae]
MAISTFPECAKFLEWPVDSSANNFAAQLMDLRHCRLPETST